MSNTITITGRATAEPDLKYTASGKAVCSFTVADNHRKKNPAGEWVDDGVTFLRVNAWEHLAEECAEKITKGATVTVTGSLRQRDYETREGEKRSSFEVQVSEAALTLPRFAPREGGMSSGRFQRPSQQAQPQDDPWGSAPQQQAFAPSNEEPPF